MSWIVAVILAGGRATRFGSEKAVAPVDGEPMIARVAAVLCEDGTPLAVNAPWASGAAVWAQGRDLPVLPDPPGHQDGPLAGVAAGLRWAASEGADVLVTAPCDTPDLPHDLIPRLLEGLGDAPAAYAVTAQSAHPLCAAWRVTLLPALDATLANGHPSVRRWLDEAGGRAVRFPRAKRFRNLNRPPEGWPVRLLDAGAAILLLLLALTGVLAILFAFSFGDALTPEAQTRHDAQARIAAATCAGLAATVVAAVLWLASRASRRR